MRKKELKQNSFLNGAFVATMGIVITKVLGMLYVIPFYAIIGEQGGMPYMDMPIPSTYYFSLYLVLVFLMQFLK